MNRPFIQITIHSAGIKYNVFNCVKSAYWCVPSTHAQKVRKGAQLRRVREFTHLRIFRYLCARMDRMKPYAIDDSSSFESLVMGDVKAGFPSPAEDIREKLDLVKLLVKHKASTFFFRIDGVSMVDAAMDDGDIIIVDRAVEPYNNCKAVCYIDGEYTVKRVEMLDGKVRLMPANELNTKYKPIEVQPENQFIIWGVVTYIIKKA